MKRISSGWTTGLTTALRLTHTHTQSTCIYTHSPGAALISAFLQLESNRYQCVFFPVYSLLVIIPSSLKAHNDPFQWGAKEATAKKITPAFFQASAFDKQRAFFKVEPVFRENRDRIHFGGRGREWGLRVWRQPLWSAQHPPAYGMADVSGCIHDNLTACRDIPRQYSQGKLRE